MKLIDSDKLIRELYKEWREASDFADRRDKEVQIYEDYCSGYADAMERATLKTLTAPIVRAAPQWIKTSDALPPDYCYVAFCAREEPIPRFGFFDRKVLSCSWDERKPTFFALGCYDIAGTLKKFNADEVECWLPVENPPTGYFTHKAYMGYRDDEMEKN